MRSDETALIACNADPDKCAKMKEMDDLCKKDPAQCEQVKAQDRQAEIDKMKARCKKSPGVCKTNTEQKRKFCTDKPGECDKDTLEMLDAMEAYIAQMGN